MIYTYVTTPTEARVDMVSFYEDVLLDELADNAPLSTPEIYLADVRSNAPDETDNFGQDITAHILKACDQPSTLKALTAHYLEALHTPQDFLHIRK